MRPLSPATGHAQCTMTARTCSVRKTDQVPICRSSVRAARPCACCTHERRRAESDRSRRASSDRTATADRRLGMAAAERPARSWRAAPSTHNGSGTLPRALCCHGSGATDTGGATTLLSAPHGQHWRRHTRRRQPSTSSPPALRSRSTGTEVPITPAPGSPCSRCGPSFQTRRAWSPP